MLHSNSLANRSLKVVVATLFLLSSQMSVVSAAVPLLNINQSIDQVGYQPATTIELPDLGAAADSVLSPAAERRLGRAFMSSVRASEVIIDDPYLSSYIRQLGHQLASNSDVAGRHFDFFMIDAAGINAFAGPYGYIGINSGLILSTQSEGELASVLAHEIAHVSQKHLMRAFDTASQMGIATAAMILAAIILGASGSPDGSIAAIASAQAGMVQQQINFTRSNEKEADHVGMQILSKSQFDPRDMPAFFSQLTQANRIYESGTPEILRTHPVTTDRIADSMGRAEQYPYRQHQSSLNYHFIRATLKAKSFQQPSDAVTHFKETLNDGRFRSEDGERYGYAIALTLNREYAEAKKVLLALKGKYPTAIGPPIALADLARKQSKYEVALEVLRTALQHKPDNYPLKLYYVETLLAAGKAPQALTEVVSLVDWQPADPPLRKLYSQVAKEAGARITAREQLAEYFYLMGEIEPAIQQLRLALSDEKSIDFYQAARISARMKELQIERGTPPKKRH
ncbi:MAG: M48 family metalloprotease [Candidatus Polarisedimenticolaceae bacterium]|nr:M48 family metalloprotease [Candidatus Polarisedimenticolaceae bacterium]